MKTLHVGILINSEEAAFGVNELLEKINSIASIKLTKVHIIGYQETKVNPLIKLFTLINYHLIKVRPSRILKQRIELPEDSPTIMVHIKDNQIQDVELNKLKQSNFDIIINPLLLELPGALYSTATEGSLTLRFGNNPNTPKYAGFWEWYYNANVNTIFIVKQYEESSEVIAALNTRADSLSLSRNQTLSISKGIDIFYNSLKYFSINGRFDYAFTKENQNYSVIKNPSTLHLLSAIFKLAYRIIYKSIEKLFFLDQWILLLSSKFELNKTELNTFTRIIPPKDRFWADPFLIIENNKRFLFFEELLYKTNKGHLVCAILNDHGQIEERRIILEKSYHLSYPFIFKHEDVWYMIPESAENKSIDLYECTSFPFGWKFKRVLINEIHAFDSTLHFLDNRIWLFCTIQDDEGGSPNDNLHLFSTDNLLKGEWTPHPLNPIVSDPYTARPAGHIFYKEGHWYRPSQICVPRYGYGLSFNIITELNDFSYQEMQAFTIIPKKNNDLLAIHTINFYNDRTIADGIIRRRLW